MVSQKDLKILVYLFEAQEKEQRVTLEELAVQFEISVRTVRNNLDRIDYYLKTNHFPTLKRDRKQGITLNIPMSELSKAKKALLLMETEAYVFSRKERILYLKMLLFNAKSYLTYEQLSRELFVSRKTVIEDIHQVREDCVVWDVQVVGSKKGIRSEGLENDKRRCLIDSLLEFFTPLELWEILRDIYPNKSVLIEKKWKEIAGMPEIIFCEESLRKAENEEKTTLTDAQYYMTIILTVLSLRRRQQGYTPIFTVSRRETQRHCFQRYFEKLERSFPECFRVEEEGYLLTELDHIFHLENLERSETLAMAMTDQLLLEVSKTLNKPYFGDEELRVSLQKHLISLIENSFMDYSGITRDMQVIVGENGLLYDSIYRCLEQYPEEELYMERKAETVLLALHFLAADERRLLRTVSDYRTLIICNNGVGTAKIVSARIKQYFPQIQIVTTIAARNAVQEIEREKPDFLISTIPFEHPNIPVIHVNTLPTEDDLKKIRIFLSGNAKRFKAFPLEDLYSRVLKTIEETCEIRDWEGLKRRLSQIFPMEEQAPELLDALTGEEIQLGLMAKDWEDAIRKSAEPLVQEGAVETCYVDCMVDNVKKMGPYIVITKGIALPHAPSTEGVRRTCISLAVLKNPVSFGNRVNDPVKLIICIAAASKKEHMREMSRLIQFISNKDAVRQVTEAVDVQEVLRVIHQLHKEEGKKET